MKAIVLFIMICTLLLGKTSCANTQNDIFERQSIEMLKEFYTAYNTAWVTAPTPQILVKKLDSLQQIYCTLQLRKELKIEFKKAGLDHDILLNDQGTDVEHLKTLKVSKDSAKLNDYIVSYIAPTADPSNKPIKVKVVIYVTVLKEGGHPKIASVR
ncbi:hypothetical protein [Pararcticibacter amylolyticus]|uniref:DUF3828 domain-containing protein n=1 Tax=Pararcticibacter amylolyticus TaxID=2173175 RepID=A0A2U2P9T7_9SPHI|nr:hypothetical protein [Pararcticibacter amylolyticus]PWG77899.1 hypothetical protein DDR33_25085 [Pararcticibacter amylolyticus]